MAGLTLIAGGGVAIGVALASQQHAPQPGAAQAGTLAPPDSRSGPAEAASAERTGLEQLASALARRSDAIVGAVAARSRPVRIEIPAIGVDAGVGEVGLNGNGTIQVPPLFARPSEAAWYRYSPTPGQVGPSVIDGHVDNIYGPAVFFRLGALRPGDRVEVTLADGTTTTFRVDGVRRYPKSHFPTALVYGPTDFAALRLITCGGAFDYSTRQYLDNTVVFASLASIRPG